MTQESTARVRDDMPASGASGASPLIQRVIGVARITAALVVFAAIATQIIDQLVNDAFVPGEYFSYFTIQTSLMNVVVLLVGGLFALRSRVDTELFTRVRVAIVAYAAVTGSVYAALLRGIPQEGFIGIQWPNEVIHVWIPLLIGLDWILAPGGRPIPWRGLWFVVAYPLVWVAFTLVRGILTGWFPYPFLEPGGPGGWGSVIAYVVGIAAFIVAVAAVAILINRVRPLLAR